jgi:hypothetical protein
VSRKPAHEVRELFEAVSAEIDRLPEPHLRALAPVMVQAEAELARDFTRWLRTIPGGEAKFTAQQLRVALVQLRAAMRRARGMSDALFGILQGAGEDAGHLALGHLARQAEKFGALFQGSMRALPFRPAAVLAKGDELLIRRFRSSSLRYGEHVAQDIQRQLAVGMVRGETFAQMTGRIQRLGGHLAVAPPSEALTAGNQMAAAVMGRNRSRAEMIVRTEAVNAYNVVADEAIGEATAEDPDYLKRWDATLDQRGCLRCRALHNTLRDHGKAFPGGMQQPPAHPRCRCCLTFWHREWGAPPAIERDAPAAAGATKKETVEVQKTPKAPAKIDRHVPRPVETVQPPAKPPAAPKPAPAEPAPPKAVTGGSGPGRRRGLEAVAAEAKRPMATKLPSNVTIEANDQAVEMAEKLLEKITGKKIPIAEILSGFNAGPETRMVLRDVHLGKDVVTFEWDVFDAKTGQKMTERDGGLVRSIFLQDGKAMVHHDFFKLEPEFQGGGAARVLNGNALLRYEKWGIAAAELEAAWAGRYAWASMGFNFVEPEDVISNLKRFVARVGAGWSEARRAEVIAAAMGLIDEPWKLAKLDIGELFEDEYNKGATKRIPFGKAFFLSRDCQMWTGRMRIAADNAGYVNALETLRVWERAE